MVNLDCHSLYSIQSSLVKIPDLIKRTLELDHKSVGLIDDNALYGAIEFYNKCKENGLKPIIGARLNICEDIKRKDRNTYTISLVAKNLDGYKNLCKLITRSYTEGFYYVPRIDYSILKSNSNNLLCLLSGRGNCVAGPWLEIHPEYSSINHMRLTEIFGKDLWICLNPYTDKSYLAFAAEIARNNQARPYLITNQVRYLNNKDYQYYDMLHCLKYKAQFDNPVRKKADQNEYLKTEYEIRISLTSLSKEQIDIGLLKSESVCEEIDLVFEKKLFFPKPIVTSHTSEEKIKQLLNDGWKKKLPKLIYADLSVYKKRLKYELGVIEKLGFTDYFLVVADIVNWGKNNRIRFGPGRGSSSGCLISYLLNITDVDPIKNNLIFERFLNPSGERISPPDIDIDVDDTKRDLVIEYITNTYGADKVACVGNLSTLAFKASVKDVGRALGIPFEKVNSLTKRFPFGAKCTADLVKDRRCGLKKELKEDQSIIRLMDFAEGVKGTMKNISTHAAGIVVSPVDITDFTPLQSIKMAKDPSKSRLTTQLDKDSIENLGLLKIDLLGLTALSIMDQAVSLIKKNKSVDIDLDNLNIDDTDIFKLIKKGHTTGIFQLEGKNMTDLAKKVKVNSVNDICDLIALYRPAVIDGKIDDRSLIEIYLDNRNNNGTFCIHKLLKEITKDTQGILLYQEQAMQAAVSMAKFTMGEADTLRKAVGKKTTKDIPILRKKFVSGCSKNGIPENEALEVFAIFEDAGYMFNRPHSYSYSVIAAIMAWLKHYYPTEFLCSYLNAENGDLKKIETISAECKYLGIEILPPDINSSEAGFSTEGTNIRYGLGMIKEIGFQTAKVLTRLRKSNNHDSIDSWVNLLSKDSLIIGLKSKLDILIQCGCFDSILPNRKKVLSIFSEACGIEKSKAARSKNNKTSLFDASFHLNENKEYTDDFNILMKRNFEKEYMGVLFS